MHAQNQTLLREVQREQGVQQDSLAAASRFLLDLRGEMAGRFAAVENEIIILQGLQGVSQQQLATLRDAVEESRGTPTYGQGGGGIMGSGAAELYEAGMASFTRGGHAAAEDAFLTIVEMHAEDPLVPDAKYYLALIQVEYDEREAAITSFREVADSYPTSPRAPEALFHVGRLFLELENRTEAANYFTRVVERYQSSHAAVLARTELDRLR
jgi:tol-pal system protein YbgF